MTRRGATRSAYVIASIGFALYVAARTTGAGWLVVIMCGLIGILIGATIWPRIAVARVRLAATAEPDATVGEPLALTLRATRAGLGCRLTPTRPIGDTTAVVGNTQTVTDVVPQQRGVLEDVTVEIGSAAPFGLVWWRRTLVVALERPTEVAPRRPELPSPTPGRVADDGDTEHASGVDGDQIRGLREYVPGDPLRLVHWPATARHGQVIVKEREHPNQPRLVIALDLTGPATAAEFAAEQAMGEVCAALDAGYEVILSTTERGGSVTAPVRGHRDAGRRLARAVPGRPALDPGTEVRLITTGGLGR